MAISRVKTWSSGEVLTASDLNAEFNNILNNGSDLVSPFTKAISMGGFALNFDAANTIALTGATNGVSLTGGALNTPQGADIASASTLNLDTATGNSPDVTGTTTITAVTLSQGRQRLCRFTGALTITNGASLVVEGGADFTTVAGQYVLFVGYASSVVRCIPFSTPSATQTLTNKTLTNPANTTQALTDAATTAWDASLGAIATWTLAASRTAGAPTNLKAGGYYVLRASMDGTGGWSVTWNAAFKGFSGGVMPQPVSVASATTQYEFTSDGTSLFLIGYSHLRASPIASGRNIAARTNSGAPNTKLDITADQLVLQDTNGNALVANTVSVTIDFAGTGANGVDAGVQALSTWYYGWIIGKPDGTIAGLASLSSSAPTMPAGYIFKALVTAARSDASTHFLKYRQFGNWVYYEAFNQANSTTTATTEQTVSVSTVVPPNALAFTVNSYLSYTSNGVGAVALDVDLRFISGSNAHRMIVSATTGVTNSTNSSAILPNVSQQFFWLANNNTNVSAAIVVFDVPSFKLPCGGE